MMNLTFGEQVKIILSRKGMTIKELAEILEERSGKKMSRQNLTQRLGRDNFQEQDMRIIADILGCNFQLSILTTNEMIEKIPTVESAAPTEKELKKLAKKKDKRLAIEVEKVEDLPKEELPDSEREITIGELADIFEDVDINIPTRDVLEETKEVKAEMPEIKKAIAIEEVTADEMVVEEIIVTDKNMESSYIDQSVYLKPTTYNQPVYKEVRHKESSQNKEKPAGDINPYTGKEYESNSVRMHPKRIGYVQVYDKGEHKWTDMTEWAFLGYQERKKALLGKEYEQPIYLD